MHTDQEGTNYASDRYGTALERKERCTCRAATFGQWFLSLTRFMAKVNFNQNSQLIRGTSIVMIYRPQKKAIKTCKHGAWYMVVVSQSLFSRMGSEA